MRADVINLQAKVREAQAKRAGAPEQGNGAREAMISSVDEAMLGLASAIAVAKMADFLLARLAADGFVIVPLGMILNEDPS